jgi:hypothetical protein
LLFPWLFDRKIQHYQQVKDENMIWIKNHKQQELFDPWRFLSPKRRKLLDQSWAGLFREELLCELPVNEFASNFKEDFGRPTKELHSALGVLLIQQTQDLTDEEAVEQLSFNTQWHYALNITEESDSAKYISTKTLWSMRNIVYQNNLNEKIFENITAKLANVFNVNNDYQRIDSVHIKSNMKRLGRISIFVTTINKFLVNLKRNHKALFATVGSNIIEKYFPEKSLKCFAMVKPSQSTKTLTSVSSDLFDLVQQFKDHPEVKNMHSYKLLERVLNEQCNVNVSDDANPVTVKAPKEIPSDSLQNPSDPDTTYSGHKGQGYQIQVMETYSKDEDPKSRKKDLNLITHVEVEPAHQSDAKAIIPAIESANQSDLAPKELLADSLYDSDENHQDTAHLGVEVVAPVMGNTKEGNISLADFELSDKGKVLSCPQGHAPAKTRKKKRYSAGFDLQHCNNCPNQSICSVKKGRKYYYLRYTAKEMRVAIRRAYEQTDEFKGRYRWRAGAEATMSEYDRRTGVKHLRVRGFKAVRFCAILKATGLNILRAAAVRRARNEDESAQDRRKRGAMYTFLIIKERVKQSLAIAIQFYRIKYICM